MAPTKIKDQTPCPKCGRIFCEGYWGEGVCIDDMHFGSDPTAAGDAKARYLRAWYEAHRETIMDRVRLKTHEGLADNFMLALLNEVHRIESAATAEKERRHNFERANELAAKGAKLAKAGGVDIPVLHPSQERIAVEYDFPFVRSQMVPTEPAYQGDTTDGPTRAFQEVRSYLEEKPIHVKGQKTDAT